jgi:predicted amidohydrolase YtcJ
MKTLNIRNFGLFAATLLLMLAHTQAWASHRVILFNQKAMDMVLEMWPDFVESVNNQSRGMEDPGQRGIITQSPLRSHLNQLLREQPTPMQYTEGFKRLVKDYYSKGGMTAFGSRLNTNQQVTAYHYMLRKDGRLPIRFAYAYDLARQPIPEAAAAGLYETAGAMWDTIESNPWLWLHGMASEGDWDAPNRGCLQNDLPVKPGQDVRQVKEILEICPDFNSATVQALMRGVRSGWRFAGVHGVGSHAIRLFVQQLEGHMKANPKVLTLDYVRDSRHGFAHGTLTGAVPDVVASMIKYNLYVPINLRRALAIEPDNIRANYGEPGWKFMGPVKTLLDAGVKVVGEAEIGHPTPETYFDLLDVYVNREIANEGDEEKTAPAKPGTGTVYSPEEGVDRVVALKLFTYRSAEFLYAETKIGSLEVGKYADFIVTDKPYLSGPDTSIRDNKVIMTVQAGEPSYQDPQFKPVIKQ